MEHDRLELQNFALYLRLEGNYPAREAVRAALVPRADRRCAVLDIGTGSGSWSVCVYVSHACLLVASRVE